MINSRPSPQRQVPDIPGSYYDLITTARDHMARSEWTEAAAIQQRVIDRIQRLPEKQRRFGADLALFVTAAAADLVEVRAELGDYGAAIDLCQQLQVLDAANAAHWRRRIPLLRIDSGESAQGLADLRALAEREPGNFEHWMALAHQGIEQGSLLYTAEALEHAWALAQADPDDRVKAMVHFTRYRLYRAQERWLEARDAWQQAAALDAQLRDATGEIVVRMFLEVGLLDEAYTALDQIELEALVADYYRAQIAYRRGDQVRARYLWRRIAQPELGDDANLALQATALCWLGEPQQALSIMLGKLDSAVEFNVRNALALGLAWAMHGNLDAARTNYALAVTSIAMNITGGKISRLDRWEFETLVQDEALRAALLPYFEA
jgi:tetratricopeptide (TPR) repeat protein